jgi:TolB-like protein
MSADPDLVREQLDRILSSDVFATAGRHSRLLRYLVERTLAGEGGQLKEYVLGTEVFDRADTYDPRIDSIVRVEVRRLRSRLEEYYREQGADDPLVIVIPRGNYVPVWQLRDPQGDPTPATRPDDGDRNREDVDHIRPQPVRRPYSPAVVIAAALSVAIVVFAAGLALERDQAPALASSGPGIAVLPFEHYSTSEIDALLVARITDAVTTELARVGTVSVVSRTTAARYTDGPDSVVEIAKALNVDFVLEASADIRGPTISVVARLVDGRLDRKVWVGEYSLRRDEVSAAARHIASESAIAAVKYVNR